MEFIQKKTADEAVAHFLPKAADKETPLAWDRFEGQLPECGFCESGLSCRDCLQGPCISHPFRDTSKEGVCGKQKDVLAIQSLLRMVLKGSNACLDQVAELAKDGGSACKAVVKEMRDLMDTGANAKGDGVFPKKLVALWKEKNVCPEGLARDIFKATQKLEGGVADAEELLLWTIKTALFGSMTKNVQAKMKSAIFGATKASEVEINMGVLKADVPNLLFYGTFSPVLKQKIATAAAKNKVNVAGVCSDPLLFPNIIPVVSSYGSQDVVVMTGAVDLIVAGDQYVNPSLRQIANDWRTPIVSTESLNSAADLDAFADEIIKNAKKAFDTRKDIKRDIPNVKAAATLGHSVKNIDISRIAAAVEQDRIKGVVILSGSNNVKYSQDNEFITMTNFYLANGFLCISEGEASIVLGKHGFMNPANEDIEYSDGLKALLGELSLPAVIDCDVSEFITSLAAAMNKEPKELPFYACFPEASRSEEVVKAVTFMAMGIDVYFYPFLPVSGSLEAIGLLTDYCAENFGAKLNVLTKKLSATEKAKLLVGEIIPPTAMSGKNWE